MCLPGAQMWYCHVQMWLCILRGSCCLLEWVVRAPWLCLGCHDVCASQDPFSLIRCFLSSCRMGSCALPIVLPHKMPLPSPTPTLEEVQMRTLSSRLVVPQHTQHTRLQIPVPQRASPSLASNPPAPPGPPFHPRPPSMQEPKHLQNPLCTLGTHPPPKLVAPAPP